MRRWILLGEVDEQASWIGSLDNPEATLERAAHFTSDGDEPTDAELAECLEGRDGEWLLLPLDAASVIRSETTTTIDVNVQKTGVYT